MPPPSSHAQSLPSWPDDAAARSDLQIVGTSKERALAQSVPQPFRTGTIYEIRGLKYWLVFMPVALLLRLYYATLRFEMSAEDRRAICDASRPVVCAVWHNRSLLVPGIISRFRPAAKFTCLISPSKAAAWEAAFFKFMGLGVRRGSSSRRSIQATRELLKVNRDGLDIALSPDGPTGPLYEFKRGAAMMARMTKAPVLLLGAESGSAWRPKTWDRHFIPLPFSKVRLHGRILEHNEVFNGGRDDSQAAAFLAKRLSELSPDHF